MLTLLRHYREATHAHHSFYIVEGEKEQAEVTAAVLKGAGSTDKISQFFVQKTQELIRANACSLIGNDVQVVDLVRDVLRLVPVYWVADIVSLALLLALLSWTNPPLGRYFAED